jgi:myo-inositol-1(or 4)-monophosphatase
LSAIISYRGPHALGVAGWFLVTDHLHDPHDLLAVAVTVARQAADLVHQQRAEGVSGLGTKSTITDLVTAADRAAERLIVDLLREFRPADQLVGEESGTHTAADRPATGVRWLVDPIDGTVNYVYGLPQYAVSIAAEVDGTAVAGVVRNAVSGEEWTAIRGGGAWREGRRLAGSVVTDLARSLIATGFSYDAAQRARQAGVLARLLPLVRDIRRLGAASLDLCYAAEGRVDAYYERGLSPWDNAAGGLVAAEAGLLVTGLRGAAAGPAMVLAAPPALHPVLHDLLVTFGADAPP